MPAEKSKKLEKAQEELQRLRTLKQNISNQMSKKKTSKKKLFLGRIKNELVQKLREELEEKINVELSGLDEKIKEAEETLRNITKPIDMVNTGVLDKVVGTVEGIVEGDPKKILEPIKDLAEEELNELIEENIKDETLAQTTIDVLDRIMDGDFKGVEKVLEEGAKEKVGELIDENVKNKKIAEILKDVADGAIDGEWDTLLDIVKDGVVDIAEDKLDEFVLKLLNLFEAQVKIKIELDMEEAAKKLIPSALGVVKKKKGTHWSVELGKVLTIRLFKETASIIKGEIEFLTSSGGLKVLTQIAKEALYATLQDGLAGRSIKEILNNLVENIAKNAAFKAIIKAFKRKMLNMFIRVATEEVERTVGPVIDAFIRVHTPFLGPILKTGKRTAKIGPLWGCINLALSIQADFTAKLTAERKGLLASAKGGLSGKVYAGIGISIGFDIPLVGDVSIEGGVQGGPEINALANLSFKFKNAVIYAELIPLTVDIDMSARLYLETPIPNRILKYVPTYLASTSVVAQTLYCPLGRINILTATTPGYTLKFDLLNKKYAYVNSSGKYSIDASPKVKAYLKDVKEAIEEAAQSVLDAVNPTNWDLNPFDEDGWAGGWF